MKVTVCFGNTGIVVPCKNGKMIVRELIQQAAQRYIKAREKEPGYWVKIRHLEYRDGGILDLDDVVADVVEDKDRLNAVFDEHDAYHRNDETNNTERLSPDPFESELAAQFSAFQPVRGEIEVTPSALKLGTPLLVRRSSDPALGPFADFHPGSSHAADQGLTRTMQGPSKILPTEELQDSTWQDEHPRLQKSRYDYSDMTRNVEMSGDGGPLGIHVVPFYSSLSGRALGLYIRGIEEHSRTRREGLFQENEGIVKINNVDLLDRSFTQAQEIFRQAMKHRSVLVEIVPSQNRELYEKSFITHLPLYEDNDAVPNLKPPPPPLQVKPPGRMVEQTNGLETGGMTLLQPSMSPVLTQHGGNLSSPSLSPLDFGSKKMAKKIRIDLKKGTEGLGFTVVTRDSTVHGPGPIFVKNILPKGAAIKDGQLLSGDRILEVHGRDVAGRTQEELVAMLRSTKLGETVSLVIARQDEAFLPRELKGEPDCHILPLDSTAQMGFEIPLNDSGSAGLGISLKGNKSRDTRTDLGIFIKSIIHGGAAFKDGRLRVNDQLIAVNGEGLLGKSNREAMETLRRSMSMEGNIRGMIQLVISRKLDRQMEERLGSGPVPRRTSESLPTLVQNGSQEDAPVFNDGYPEKDVPPHLRPHPSQDIIMDYSKFSSRVEYSVGDQHMDKRSLTQAQQLDSVNLKASKSMDLVADESNISSLTGHKSVSPGKDFGPRLGLKKSSSLESLQTAVAEVKKNDLPFYRPRPHVVRGRGCNESFRTAIDKSYDGPEAEEEDGLSDVSSRSGPETPTSESAPLGNPEFDDADKAKKDKKKKDKKQEKGKSKVKDKKRREEREEQEKKAKKKGFGAMLRFGKKKEDKGGKVDHKGNLKHGVLKEEEHELEKMKEERESGRPTSGNADRIQQLRMEYHQARREGLQLYEEEDGMGRPLEYDQNWVSARGPEGLRNLRFDGMERQYASLPRRGPLEQVEYMSGPRAVYREREPPYYCDVTQGAHPSKGIYSRTQANPADNYRFPTYQPPPTKGPLRQDVPPSPQGHRLPGYSDGGRSGPDRYQYRPQDPRQKNPMTAAV
ncbi:partitioning defective 3 homolog B isoform X2 [Ascaphus truei]|uniref:partitioning defective 3 homolog B isoform X2 n=1 Tax=Ascaphus truei TaxID=8439 RepID=UPI003F5A07CC